ncbi:MAG: glycoside hydrolase family 5 protein [Treponema sp.]|jgi:endoglucanase|nr:glycoside hydrolase family 5 protein [Treponema sp.]
MKRASVYLSAAAMLTAAVLFTAILTAACRTANPDLSELPNYRFDTSDTPGYITDAKLPFSRGLNFTTWFEAPSPRAIVFTKYTEQEFKNAKSLGVDVIRLPINLHSMTSGSPAYTLDPLFLKFLDQAVDWAEQYEIYLILDNHSFDPVANTDPEIDKILIPVWTQMARRYKDRSKYVLYEILNEPHGIAAQEWADIQGKVAAAIRAIDPVHSIVVGGVGYNSIDELFNLPIYDYDNIIYTFHFYDPYLFTHQGETWGSPPNLRTLKGMPFPADAHALPQISAELKGTWIEGSIKQTYARDAAVAALAEQLDKAARFSRENGNVPLLCGEFGVFIPNSLPRDRLRWYQIVTKLLDNRNIARTSWDYYGGFGIYKTDRGGSFESDLNIDIITAMGFTVPPQKTAETIRGAFTMFDNYPDPLVNFTCWNGDFDLYHPNGDKYALSWRNANRYGSFFFSFIREIDWEYLQSNGYAVTFTAKADKDARFDLRFTAREDASSIPWRVRTTVDLAADGQWHTLRIPLSDMQEQGAWINARQEWRNPEGKFTWSNADSLAFVAEDNDLHGITVLFDTIKIE